MDHPTCAYLRCSLSRYRYYGVVATGAPIARDQWRRNALTEFSRKFWLGRITRRIAQSTNGNLPITVESASGKKKVTPRVFRACERSCKRLGSGSEHQTTGARARRHTQHLAVIKKERRAVGLAQGRRVGQYLLIHRCQLDRRACDDIQYVLPQELRPKERLETCLLLLECMHSKAEAQNGRENEVETQILFCR